MSVRAKSFQFEHNEMQCLYNLPLKGAGIAFLSFDFVVDIVLFTDIKFLSVNTIVPKHLYKTALFSVLIYLLQ